MTITAPTPEQVRSINGSVKDDTVIDAFISPAVCIAEQVELCMSGKGLSSECQTSVATWLAAHLMASSGIDNKSRVKKREKFENYTVEWAQSTVSGDGIMSSTFGQTANAISGGCLAEIDKRNTFIGFFGGA